MAFAILPFPVSACVCVRIAHEEEIENTSTIFVGKVIKITEDKDYVPPKIEDASYTSSEIQKLIKEIQDSKKRFFVDFEVEKGFKGIETEKLTLVMYYSPENACNDLVFVEKSKYLVYAKERNGELVDMGICSRTQNFKGESDDYKELLKISKKKEL